MTDDDDDDDAFDARGLLIDGRTYRVPLKMADSLQRDVARHALTTQRSLTDAASHRPGFRGARAVNDKREALYQQRDTEDANAWRRGNVGRKVQSTKAPSPKAPSSSVGRDAFAEAYRQRDHDLANAWRSGGAL